MLLERRSAGGGGLVGRIRVTSDERLPVFDVGLFFQSLQMGREIAVGHIQKFLQRAEIQLIVHHERGHDSQSDPALERLVQRVEVDAHGSTFALT